ncbi:phosphotransferase family protein [Agromyces sp. NPDC057679]|uniref:phosphotransferase family protein n=1 Tax=Agromyces sp. NPDC057679 TaxID=3346207 RepID=UPI003672857F
MTDARPLLDRVAARWAAGCGGTVRLVEPLSGGFANAVARVTLDDGRTAVVKLAPPPVAGLTHERELLRTEAFALAALAGADAPQPELLGTVELDGREAIVLSELDGAPPSDEIDPAEFGGLLAALHRAGADAGADADADGSPPVFGYPFRTELQAPTARAAYLAQLDAVLADARRFDVGLPVDARVLRERLHEASDAFDEVVAPTLVHFDLWDGNLLARDGRITGVIDHERAMWADPTADLPSRYLMRAVPAAVDADEEFRRAYAAASGAEPMPGAAARTRARLWTAYLALVMTVEAAPRAYSGSWFEEHDRAVRRWLVETVDELG